MKLLLRLSVLLALVAPAAAQLSLTGVGGGSQGSGGAALACSYTPVTTGTQSAAYTGGTPSASGGTPTYTFSETGALPTGITINTTTGVLSGTPSVSGTFAGIQVKVTDSLTTVANCGSSFTLTIAAGSAYTGPGDINGAAVAWYGLRAFNAAKRGTKVANVCNSTGGVDVGCADLLSDVTTGALVPATVSGITCPGANCTVKTLYDQAGTNCSGTTACDVTQATVANRPTLTTAAITCNGSSQRLLGSTNLTQAQPFSVSYVAKRTTFASTFANVIAFGNLNVQIGYADTTGNAFLYGGSVAYATAAENTMHAVQGLMNQSTSAMYIDGTNTAGLSVSVDSPSATPTIICSSNSPDNWLNGQILETGIWGGNVTANNSAMNSNQHTFWGF